MIGLQHDLETKIINAALQLRLYRLGCHARRLTVSEAQKLFDLAERLDDACDRYARSKGREK